MQRIAMTLVAVSVLCGCEVERDAGAGPILRWAKPATTEQQFYTDRFECLKEARGLTSNSSSRAAATPNFAGGRSESSTHVSYSAGMFGACMTARGYRSDPAGPFHAPPGTVVQFE